MAMPAKWRRERMAMSWLLLLRQLLHLCCCCRWRSRSHAKQLGYDGISSLGHLAINDVGSLSGAVVETRVAWLFAQGGEWLVTGVGDAAFGLCENCVVESPVTSDIERERDDRGEKCGCSFRVRSEYELV